jgi:FMNH2-dependent dimethyl sulfone monooxygenase
VARDGQHAANAIRGTQLEQRVSLEDYSVSNRGLRTGLVGTPQQVADRIGEFERAGVNLLLLQFSPQAEEMDRFSQQVIKPSIASAKPPNVPART